MPSQRRMIFLLGCWLLCITLVLLAAAQTGCGGSPTGPTLPSPSPSPSASAGPTPTPQAPLEPFHPGLIPSLRGATNCCDDPNTAEDEGLVRGWPFFNSETLSLYVSNRVNLTEVRVGPNKAGGQDPEPEEALRLYEEALTAAEAQGVYVLVGVWDGWLARHGFNYWGDTCEVTQQAPQERHVEWARRVATIAARHRNALVMDGNEQWLCRPKARWVHGLEEAVKSAGVTYFGSNARLGLGDYQVDHGFKAVPGNTILAESDNESHSPEEWAALQRASGGAVIVWRGPDSIASWSESMRRVAAER